MKSLRYSFILTLTLVLTFHLANAEVINVPGDFNAIQDAIDDGDTDSGDTVQVADGVYTENIDFGGKNVVLRGNPSDPSAVTIDGDDAGPVIRLHSGESSDAVVTGFTLTGGASTAGAGIQLTNSSEPHLSYLILTGNVATGGLSGGAGIDLQTGCDAVLEYVTITENEVDYLGGGIGMYQCSPTFSHCVIQDNLSHDDGGGGYIWQATPSFDHCLFADNVAEGPGTRGGGLLIHQATATFDFCTFAGNDAENNSDADAFFVEYTSTVDISNSIIRPDSYMLRADAGKTVTLNIEWTDWNSSNHFANGGTINYNPSDLIQADPLFADVGSGDYHLTSTSPCLDAADPNADDDSDGTRADMGYAFFDQTSEVTVEITSPNGGKEFDAGDIVTIEWTAESELWDLDECSIYYSADHGNTWTLIDVEAGAGPNFDYDWTVPDEYSLYGMLKVVAEDDHGYTGEDLTDDVFTYAPVEASFPVSPKWWYLSLPLEPDDNDPENVVGQFIDGIWQMYGFFFDQGYFVPDELAAGNAYWLVVAADTVEISYEGTAYREAVTIDLQLPWNAVGDPFPITLGDGDITFRYDGDDYTIDEAGDEGLIIPTFYKLGEHPGDGYGESGELDPWTGYWFCTLVEDAQLILFPADPGGPPEPSPQRDDTNPHDWRLLLTADDGNVSRTVELGAHPSANDEFDASWDRPFPPGRPESEPTRIAIVQEDWNPVIGSHYLSDIRAPLDDDQQTWTVEIVPGEVEQVTMRWENLSGWSSTVPQNHEFSLTDLAQQNTIDMREQQEYRLNLAGQDTYTVTITVTAPELSVGTIDRTEIPDRFTVESAFPNPFNSTVSIRYGLPSSAAVRLTVHDIAGRQIASLLDARRPAGYHSVIWQADGVESGVYFYQLKADGLIAAGKLMLVR